jgi:tetratricopeptide (TPR) repeat protein
MAAVLNNLGQVAGTQGDYVRAREIHRESLSIVRDLDDRRMLALPLYNLGVVAHHEGDFTSARTYHEEALEIRKSLGDVSGIAYSTRAMAHVLHHMGESPTAHELFNRSISQFRDIGDRVGLAQSLTRFAEAAREAGNDDEASACIIEALLIWREIGARGGVTCLEEVAMLAADRNRAEQAVTLFSAAEAIRRQIGEPMPPFIERERGEMLELLQLSLGSDVFETAWNAGKTLEPDAAIEMAITEASGEKKPG